MAMPPTMTNSISFSPNSPIVWRRLIMRDASRRRSDGGATFFQVGHGALEFVQPLFGREPQAAEEQAEVDAEIPRRGGGRPRLRVQKLFLDAPAHGLLSPLRR
jgi:hypothetical protein